MSQLEAWQMVLVNQTFFSTTHGEMGCTACHLGDSKAETKDVAHKGLVAYPSSSSEQFCAGCHADVTTKHQNSLHYNVKGYYKRIEKRLGYDISTNPDLVDKFDAECGKCHASCGQCHVSRPVSVDGGFLNGHTFQKEPDMRNNCTACHGSRVGAEYFGENAGINPDVHWIPNVKRCTFCHSEDAMHSSSVAAEHRYEDQDMVRCEDCHQDKENANNYHNMHWGELSCQVCHSQSYKNCNSCHTGGQGITGSSYMDFKIARNPIRSADRNYKIVTVRHIPISRDTYASWGIADLPNYSSETTWKYATPHNIQRWTPQTDTRNDAGSCGSKCHNSDYYLTSDDLDPNEIDANKQIVLTKN